MASGIDVITTRVDRHEPRNSTIISAVSAAAMAPSRSTAWIDCLTNTDWSNSSSMCMPLGAAARAVLSVSTTAFTTSRVEALPFLMMLSSTERCPSRRTTFCCTSQPSCTWPMSLRKTVAPFTTLTGMLLRSSMVAGIALVSTVYCVSPILAVPEGRVRFWAFTAFTMSSGVRPCATSFSESMSTMIWRYLPPVGVGKVTPGIGASCWRMR